MSTSRILWSALVGALTFGAGAAASAAETAIEIKHSGKYLDVEGASTDNGARLIQWPFHGGDNQIFDVRKDGNSVFQLRAVHSNKCIDIEGASMDDGARVIQWPCHGGDNQRFLLARLRDGSYLIIARHSGKCLDVAGASKKNGAPLIQYRCHGGKNQRFYLEDLWNLVEEDDALLEIDALGAETEEAE